MGSAFLVHSSVTEIMIVKMEVMKKTAVKVRIFLILLFLLNPPLTLVFHSAFS